MKAFSYKTDNGLSQIGIELEGVRYNFSQAWELYKDIENNGKGPSLGFLQIMVEADFFHSETFEEVFANLRKHRPVKDLMLQGEINYQLPIGRPQKILGIGRNYQKHADELDNPVPSEPVFFAKSPSTLIPHDGLIKIPASVGRVDLEAELAIVISRECKNISAKYAMDFVAGYTIINDITARDLQKADIEQNKPWFRSKNFDTFCPCGPVIVPKQATTDLKKLSITSRINGEEKQSGKVSDMIFDVEELVAYLSRHCTLFPGDIISTGTPAGVAEIHSGDVVECEIEGIGILRNRVQ